MDIVVRRAENRDTARIRELLLQVCHVHAVGRPDIFRDGGTKYTDAALMTLIEDDTRPIFVAVDPEGKVLGYCFTVLIVTENSTMMVPRKELYIDDLCVDEAVRRQHVGQILYDHVKAFAKEIGCYHLTLNVWACNPAAMRFYEKQGMAMLKKEMEVIL